MAPNRALVRRAVATALRLRLRYGHSIRDPLCPYDLAEQAGIEVRFMPLPSLEGVFYDSVQPTIFLSCLRPMGRRAFTCAHELGHWALGHSLTLDELEELRTSHQRPRPEESAAQAFAGSLLMPLPAVEAALTIREYIPSRCTPEQILILASVFGVGYTTVVDHLAFGLGLISAAYAADLKRRPLRDVRESFIGRDTGTNLVVIDQFWTRETADVEVGDVILTPCLTSSEGTTLRHITTDRPGTLLEATQPGVTRLTGSGGRAVFVRVSKRAFVGRAIFRHLPEEADDEPARSY